MLSAEKVEQDISNERYQSMTYKEKFILQTRCNLQYQFIITQFEIITDCIRIPKKTTKEDEKVIISSHEKRFNYENLEDIVNYYPLSFFPQRGLINPLHGVFTSNRLNSLIYDSFYGI